MFSHSLPLRMFDRPQDRLAKKTCVRVLVSWRLRLYIYIYKYISPVYIFISLQQSVRVTILGEKTCIAFYGDKTRWLAFAFFGSIGR